MSDTSSFNVTEKCQIHSDEEVVNCSCGDINCNCKEVFGFNWIKSSQLDYSNKFQGTPLDDYVNKTIVGNFKLSWDKGPEIFKFLTDTTGGQVVLTYECKDDQSGQHLHFLLWDSKIQPDTLKAYIRKKIS